MRKKGAIERNVKRKFTVIAGNQRCKLHIYNIYREGAENGSLQCTNRFYQSLYTTIITMVDSMIEVKSEKCV
jgi:hypothetical protein